MLKPIRFFVVCFLLAGCSAAVESRLDSVRADYMTAPVSATDLEDKNNLDLLITADTLFHYDDYAGADAAYEIFNRKNPGIQTRGDTLREISTLAFGANANDYRPYMMDSLFVSYYQLWAALATGRKDDARVIINQSYARQTDMSREYEKLIESNKKSLAENSELATRLYDDNAHWAAYRDIMNPALMYLSGIYFLDAGEFSDAETYLSRANGMMPKNSFIKQDLKLAESKTRPQNTVWVFIEDGFAPKLTERRITLPFFIDGGMVPMTIATTEPNFLPNFMAIDGAQKLADVDAMFMTEYGEYKINESLRAVAAAASRTALQSVMYNSNSKNAGWMGLLSTIYSEFTTNADVRTWATLPKTISVIRVANNKSGLIELRAHGNVIERVSVPTFGNHLVYVRIGPNDTDIKVITLKK